MALYACTVKIIKSYGGISIESESSVALLLSNSIYQAHPPENIIVSKMFLLFRKKRKHAKAFISKNGHITKKVLGYSGLSMITYATIS